MTVIYWIAGGLSAALLIYLIIAMLKPEYFS